MAYEKYSIAGPLVKVNCVAVNTYRHVGLQNLCICSLVYFRSPMRQVSPVTDTRPIQNYFTCSDVRSVSFSIR